MVTLLRIEIAEFSGAKTIGELQTSDSALWTIKEASEFLRVPPRTLRLWAELGEIPAVKTGRQWRFRRRDLEEWLARPVNPRKKTLACGNNGKYGKYGIGVTSFHGKHATGPRCVAVQSREVTKLLELPAQGSELPDCGPKEKSMTCRQSALALVCCAMLAPMVFSQEIIQPEGSVDLYACVSPPPIWPIWVEFYSGAVGETGYHYHTAGQPQGKVNPTGDSTDPTSGCAHTVFSVPEQIAGQYTVTASGGGLSDSATIYVHYRDGGYYYLDALPPHYSYQLVGGTSSHPINHYGTFNTVYRIQQICIEFYNATGGVRAGVNDMSLPLGGLFDIGPVYGPGQYWQSPHSEHRKGLNADMPFQFLGTLEQRALFQTIASKWDGQPDPHPTNNPNHFHLRFPY